MTRRVQLGLALAGAAVGAALCGAACAQTAPPVKNPFDHGNITGLWIKIETPGPNGVTAKRPPEGTPVFVKDIDGNPAPLTPWAKAITDQRLKDMIAGHPHAMTKSRCLPAGLPRSMDPPGALPIQILADPDQVTILFEEFFNFRTIHMDGRPHPDLAEWLPAYYGHSVGHWEGDTLVVDSVGFTTETTLDSPGTPHSDQMHIVERIRRVGADRLEDQLTLTDPVAYTKPWTIRTLFKALPKSDALSEYFCDNDRNTPDATGHTGITLQSSTK